MNLQEFKALSNVAKSEYLRANFQVNAKSSAMRKLVFGVAINDADYMTGPRIEGDLVRCPAYAAWKNMLARAYYPKYHAGQPTYVGVIVCSEWHSFMTFRKWWIGNQVDEYALDKDILGNSLEYSEKFCIFVPSWLNNFTTDSQASRGDYPIGVAWDRSAGKYKAECSHPFGKKLHIGYFTNANEAHAAWLARKLEIAEELKSLMDEVDLRIYPRVVEITRQAK